MTIIPTTTQLHDDWIVTSSPMDPRARPLLEALIGEYSARYGDLAEFGQDAAREEVYGRYASDRFLPPHGNFLLIVRNGEAIAGGGFMPHEETDTAELKRIWTAAHLRRQGLARRIVFALEDAAIRQGYRRIFLTTGFRQPEASALYKRLGYTPLYDPKADPAVLMTLPFAKAIGDNTAVSA
ncbi:hypothetical protein NS277_11830 [Novosphingobium barchaimii]|uniref:GNAT family N-acetyltransferase n=1 Tax=uncultured Novosphingobium sp. TaxID=292277 RepID=UPI0007376097|nr:GNAT family N-acetyltransferase [uncultured Novosphingobium sp.]KTR82916.1 hypothetical protein NS277_11830 [Novosphingobium barchaimii]